MTETDIVNAIQAAIVERDWKKCFEISKEAIKDGIVVQWEAIQRASVDYAEWKAGNGASWKASRGSDISWSLWTVPSPKYRMGIYWSGGSSSRLNEGGTVRVEPIEIESFFNAAQKI